MTDTEEPMEQQIEPQMKKLKLSEIEPYWNNPRISAHAVNQVADSISTYGYNQPIIVDEKNVIIAGHTRWMALKQLKWRKKVDVIVSHLDEELAKQYRIADNRTGENARWDMDYLRAEMRGMSDEARSKFWTQSEIKSLMDGDLVTSSSRPNNVSEAQIEAHRERLATHHERIAERANRDLVDVKCSSCGEEFSLNRTNALANAEEDRHKDAQN